LGEVSFEFVKLRIVVNLFLILFDFDKDLYRCSPPYFYIAGSRFERMRLVDMQYSDMSKHIQNCVGFIRSSL